MHNVHIGIDIHDSVVKLYRLIALRVIIGILFFYASSCHMCSYYHYIYCVKLASCTCSYAHMYLQFCMPDEARDGRNVALIDKCFMVCSIVQRRIKLLHIYIVCATIN